MGSPRETTELQWCFLLFCCWQWPPRLPLRQMLRLRLTLTFSTEDTTDMAYATAMATATPMEATTTERGLLILSPRPRLMLIPTCCTEGTTDISATDTATATPTGTDTTARGLLIRPRCCCPCCRLPLCSSLRCPCRRPRHPVHHLQDLHPRRLRSPRPQHPGQRRQPGLPDCRHQRRRHPHSRRAHRQRAHRRRPHPCLLRQEVR